MLDRMKPQTAYAFTDAIRTSLEVGSLGLSAAGKVTDVSALSTISVVEGFCSLLTFVVFVHEVANLIYHRYVEDDDGKENGYPLSQHTTYLSFRLASILASVAGLSLIVTDLLDGDHIGSMAAVGTTLVAIGIFASRALSGSGPKDIKVDKAEKIVKDIEEGRASAPPPSLVPTLAAAVPVPVMSP